jgi:hypothetical protein
MKGMKFHDYHVMMQEILPLCMRHNMAKGYKMPIIQLWHVLKKLGVKNMGSNDNGGH